MSDVVTRALSDPIFPTIGLALAATVAALWLAAAWWAYRDATRRAGSPFVGLLAAAWIVVSSPFLLPFALAVYTFARPQHTAAEGRSRRLVEELAAQLEEAETVRCSYCQREVDGTWLRCPTCATWLAQPCSKCGGWSEPGLEICPWCGSEDRLEPAVEQLHPLPEAVATPGTRTTPTKRRGRARESGPRDIDVDLGKPRRGLVAAAVAAADRGLRKPARAH